MFSDYLLECPSADVRNAFGKLIMSVAHFSLQEGANCTANITRPSGGTLSVEAGSQMSNRLLNNVLMLMKKEVGEHSRHLSQYFNLFFQYANIGQPERDQLLSLNVCGAFMALALEEGVQLQHQQALCQILHENEQIHETMFLASSSSVATTSTAVASTSSAQPTPPPSTTSQLPPAPDTNRD